MKIVFRPETPGFLDLSLTPFTGPLEDESLLAPRTQMSDWPSVAGVGWAVIALSQDLKSHFGNP